MVLPAGIPVNVAAIFTGAVPARVAMSLYDDSGTSPSLVSGPTVMVNVVSNSYRSKVTLTNGKPYIVFMAVYTDGTFSTLDGAFVQVVQAVNAQFLNPPAQNVIGVVDCGGNS